MKLNVLSAITAAALAFSVAPALAVTFDAFDANQFVDAPETESNSIEFTSPTGLTATRTLTVENTKQLAGANVEGVTDFKVQSGFLQFVNDPGARGIGTLTYDFGGAVDLTLGQRFKGFNFIINDFDQIANFTATATGGGVSSTFFETVTGASNPFLSFSEFAGVDFTQLTSLTFVISSENTLDSVDGSLDAIDLAPIPLPASGLLLLAGVGGMSLLRRRRKA